MIFVCSFFLAGCIRPTTDHPDSWNHRRAHHYHEQGFLSLCIMPQRIENQRQRTPTHQNRSSERAQTPLSVLWRNICDDLQCETSFQDLWRQTEARMTLCPDVFYDLKPALKSFSIVNYHIRHFWDYDCMANCEIVGELVNLNFSSLNKFKKTPFLTQLSWNENWVCEIGRRRPPLVS